jgi:hypothetical protein
MVDLSLQNNFGFDIYSRIYESGAGPGGRVGLRPLGYWDRGLESC